MAKINVRALLTSHLMEVAKSEEKQNLKTANSIVNVVLYQLKTKEMDVDGNIITFNIGINDGIDGVLNDKSAHMVKQTLFEKFDGVDDIEVYRYFDITKVKLKVTIY